MSADITITRSTHHVLAEGNTQPGLDFLDGYLPIRECIDYGRVIVSLEEEPNLLKAARNAGLSVEHAA